MSRQTISNQNATNIINSPNETIGLILMNVSGVDIYVSDDQRQLNTVDPTSLIPTVGFLLPANQVLPTVITPFKGTLFARAVNDALLEVISFPVEYKKC